MNAFSLASAGSHQSLAVMLAVLVFVALLLLIEGLFLLWRSAFGAQARNRARRLKALSAQDSRFLQWQAALRQADSPSGTGRVRFRQLLQGPLQQAQLPGRPWHWLLASLLLALGVAVLLHDTHGSIALMGGAMAGLLPTAYVLWRRQQRLARLQQQLPDALDMIARALRAGHALSSALQMAGEELSEPLALDLRSVNEELRFGLGLPQALAHWVERAPLAELRYLVVAVLIQRESGGNLAEVLGKLAQLMRSRQRLLDRVRVLSSEGRLSAWILVLLPFALAALLAVFNPQFISPLWTDPIGVTLLKGMGCMMTVGVWMMLRIVRIRV